MRHISTKTALIAILLLSGCVTTHQAGNTPTQEATPEEMVLLNGKNGEAVSWDQLVDYAMKADIVVLAEQHDDGSGHRFQTALVEDALEAARVALCMEMFERDEQALVNAYLAGEITAKTLVDATDSADWGAKGKWNDFYQPTVDAAKAAGTSVVAANAPRRFVRIARHESFEKLTAFADSYPGHFAVPSPIEQAEYAERFKGTMRHHSAPGAKASDSPPAMPEEMLEAMFRAQQVWDATMAESVIAAQRKHGKAILLVGQFHTDFDGGLLLRMKAAAPDLNYLTISVQQAVSPALRDEDRNRADIVVYRPEE